MSVSEEAMSAPAEVHEGDEDGAIFEINDFTNATAWEGFIADLERIFHQWGLAASDNRDEQFSSTKQHRKSERISYAGWRFVVTLEVSRGAWGTSPATSPGQSSSPRRNWSPAMFEMMDSSGDFPPKAHHISRWYGVSEFVLIAPDEGVQALTSQAQAKLMLSSVSVAVSNTGCGTPVFVQVQHKWRQMYVGLSCGVGLQTSFDTVHLKHTPSQFRHLSGLLDLFKSKLRCPLAKMDPVQVAARLTYVLKQWSLDDWPLEPLGDVNREIEPASLRTLPVGAIADPIHELHLSSVWPSLTEELVVDTASYTDLKPTHAPLWTVQAKVVDNSSCLLAEHLLNFLKVCYCEDSLTQLLGHSPRQLDDEGVSVPLFSDALTRLTVPVAVLSSPLLSSVVHSASHTLDLRNRGVAVGGVSSLPDRELETILRCLFPDAYETAPPPDADGSEASDGLSFRLKSAPRGCLTTLLANALCIINDAFGLRALATVWFEVVQELRYRWENGLLIKNIPEGSPDMSYCLLHQKLQMLNCCVKHKLTHQQKLNTPNIQSPHSHSKTTDSKTQIKNSQTTNSKSPLTETPNTHSKDQAKGIPKTEEFSTPMSSLTELQPRLREDFTGNKDDDQSAIGVGDRKTVIVRSDSDDEFYEALETQSSEEDRTIADTSGGTHTPDYENNTPGLSSLPLPPSIECSETGEEDDHTSTEDHTSTVGDHTNAEGGHTNTEGAHTSTEGDHTNAEGGHTNTEGAHTSTEGDHTNAEGDHTNAEGGHTNTEGDHTNTEGDHTNTEGGHTNGHTNDHTSTGDQTNTEGDHTSTDGDQTNTECDQTEGDLSERTEGGVSERVGALEQCGDLVLVATGEPLYIPVTQEYTPMTEDMMWEQASVLANLGTSEEAARIRAKMQSSSLISDMEAFKAANPGCLLEDFVRWYSPRDWEEVDTSQTETSRDPPSSPAAGENVEVSNTEEKTESVLEKTESGLEVPLSKSVDLSQPTDEGDQVCEGVSNDEDFKTGDKDNERSKFAVEGEGGDGEGGEGWGVEWEEEDWDVIAEEAGSEPKAVEEHLPPDSGETELQPKRYVQGRLSVRMCQPDNIWVETWHSTAAQPAYKQKRLFDDTTEAEKVLHYFAGLKPSSLVLSLMPVALHSGIIALRKRLKEQPLANVESILQDATALLGTIQSPSLETLPKYQECVTLLFQAEHSLAAASSLRTKLTQGLKVISGEGLAEAKAGSRGEIDISAEMLLEGPELTIKDPTNSVTGLALQGLLTMAHDTMAGEVDLDMPRLGSQPDTDVFPAASGKEFLLRATLPRPAPYSHPSPQRMFCVLTKNEFRVAGAMTSDLNLS